jgi:hypothetical protein
MKRYLIAILCVFWAGAAAAQDAIDLRTAVVHNSPADVASWAPTTRISQLTMLPENTHAPGLSFEFPAHGTWPNYTPPGWDGPIQYTVWAGVRISGVWHVSGIIQMWRERESTGAPILTNNNFARNWVYDSRWGAMAGYQPVAGEAMIFFLTAGNARGNPNVTSVRERSNVVMVNLPAGDNGVFPFAEHQRQTDLLIDFGAEGLWTLTDAATYSQINPANAKNMITGDIDGDGVDEAIVDFGDARGIWIRWNSGVWSQLNSGTADSMVAADIDGNGRAELIVGFAGTGTYVLLNGQTWVKVNDRTASRMIVTNIDGGVKDVLFDFPGSGVWMFRNGTSWLQIHAQNPTDMVAGDFDGNGVGDVAFAFPGTGVWLLMNASTWVQWSGQDAVHLAAGDVDGNRISELVVDFGAGGIWLLRNYAQWLPLHALTAQQIVLGDLDGNGRDDIIFNFGTANGGVWILANQTTWLHALANSPEQIVVGAFN